MAPLFAPDLTSVLAELEETVGGLADRAASRQNSQWFGCKEPHEKSRDSLVSACLGTSDIGEHVAETMVVCDPDVKMDACLSGSDLQVALDSQLRVFEDITNSISDEASPSGTYSVNDPEKPSGEAFTDVRFLQHARAKPCRHCRRCFFPRSLAFHEAACAQRAALELVACPKCHRELRKYELPGHLAKCGKAMQRMLELSERLVSESSSASCTGKCGQDEPCASGDGFSNRAHSRPISAESSGSSSNTSYASSLSSPISIGKSNMDKFSAELECVEGAAVTHANQGNIESDGELVASWLPSLSWIQHEIDPALCELEAMASLYQERISSGELLHDAVWNSSVNPVAPINKENPRLETASRIAIHSVSGVAEPTDHSKLKRNFNSDPFKQLSDLRCDVRLLCNELSALPGLRTQ